MVNVNSKNYELELRTKQVPIFPNLSTLSEAYSGSILNKDSINGYGRQIPSGGI